jgi:hypothetical protein
MPLSRSHLGTPELKITMEALFEMTLYRSHSHYLARSLSKAQLSQLTPAQRKARTRAQQRLSKARIRGHKTFAYPATPEPRLGTTGGTGSVRTIPPETSSDPLPEIHSGCTKAT